jgi:aspartoacylase
MPSEAPPGGSILVVGGTHGNERHAPWLLEQWRADPSSLTDHGFALELVVGNPAALAAGRRYIDRDLNRSFDPVLLADPQQQSLEVLRARALLQRHGPDGVAPALLALDLHSTTASMGNSLVVYGRRPCDLALAAGLQQRLGLPVYLHEADAAQSGFLVECWPCGVVIEVGPVPQGVLRAAICQQTQRALEAALAVLAAAAAGDLRLPPQLVVHRHLGSVDLPRRDDGSPAVLLHPNLEGADWRPLRSSDPVFIDRTGSPVPLGAALPPHLPAQETYWPVFINEAAYGEKGIAFSLTTKESWPVQQPWLQDLVSLSRRLQRGEPL